jgi:hypothetical protein
MHPTSECKQKHSDIKGLHNLSYEKKVQIIHNILKIAKNVKNRNKIETQSINLKNDQVNSISKNIGSET